MSCYNEANFGYLQVLLSSFPVAAKYPLSSQLMLSKVLKEESLKNCLVSVNVKINHTEMHANKVLREKEPKSKGNVGMQEVLIESYV